MDTAISLALLGAAIGINNLAVSLALGSLGQARSHLRIVPVFGLFEFAMPLVGIAVGRQFSTVIADRIGWLSPVLLMAVGVWTVWSALSDEVDVEALAERATTWSGLLLLAATLSLDNVIVGFSLGLREVSPLVLAALISGFSMVFTLTGLRLGGLAHRSAPRFAGAASGVLLVGLGIVLAV